MGKEPLSEIASNQAAAPVHSGSTLCNILCYIFQENTLQVILATDTDKMFVLFLYEDIQWGNVGSFRTIIGFNVGDGVRAFTLPLSQSGFTETILAAKDTSNMNVPGAYAFRVDQENITEPAIGMF